MPNYAEELAYWYLRLNGFFLIENFVIHREGREAGQIGDRSDADLLAVRFPNVIEKLGEDELKCDTDFLFKEFSRGKVVGIIVEVKSGENWDRLRIFEDENRMRYALRRFGFLTAKRIEELASGKNWRTKDYGEYQVGKLLVHDLRELDDKYQKEAVSIKLSVIRNFIGKRFTEHRVEKFASRLFFPSSLMQFLSWEKFRKCYPNEEVKNK